MKNIVVLIFVCATTTAFGQSSIEHLEVGISKHESGDCKGAIKDYTKAIKADKKNTDAYYNRGTCELALENYSDAMDDFSQAIELNPNFTKAYYSRATVYVSEKKYIEALPDLHKLIELDAAFPNALTLRGQIRAQIGELELGCEDFKNALANGDQSAQSLIDRFCGSSTTASESFELLWPEEENWILANEQDNAEMTMYEYIHSNESLEKWTELGSIMALKGAKAPLDNVMNMLLEQSKDTGAKANLTFIEKDENAAYPWSLFTIESPAFEGDDTPESQLWYIVQGKSNLYLNFIAVKEAQISPENIAKWSALLKSGQVVSE